MMHYLLKLKKETAHGTNLYILLDLNYRYSFNLITKIIYSKAYSPWKFICFTGNVLHNRDKELCFYS